MSQARNLKRFTISEVAADWHELMMPQHTMRPTIAHVGEQLDVQFAGSRHIIIIIIITDIYMARIRKMQQKRQVNCYSLQLLS